MSPPGTHDNSGGTIAVTGGVGGTGSLGGKGGAPGKGGGVTAIDDRDVETPARLPPAISGGTLLALREGGRAVVSDSDRDRIVFVDLENRWVDGTVELAPGAEPGRLVEGTGEVHALLRGTGELVTIDLTTQAIVSKRSVCKAPRGLVFDEAQGTVLVACLEGRIVELPASEGEPIRSVHVDVDLRDLVLIDGKLLATRFRSAELLELDSDLTVTARKKLSSNEDFSPSVAWRAIAGPDGSLIVAHQRGTTRSLLIGDDGDPLGAAGEASSGGEAGIDRPRDEEGYGSTVDPCAGIVESAVTTFSASGTVFGSPRLSGVVLPVDIAVSETSGLVAIASAGAADPEAPLGASGLSVGVYTRQTLDLTETAPCSFPDGITDVEIPTVAVAFEPGTDALLALTREPATLRIYGDQSFEVDVIELGGISVRATGHDLFHRDTGGGLACASCHPEGTDDGRVWNFSGLGPRRTQPLDVGLFGSEPFHWGGELENLDALMGEVFTRRMRGAQQTPERVAALAEYLFQLPARPGTRDANDAAALRGKVLFESEAVGCTECHKGSTFSTNDATNIGKGDPMQVPSLIGVSARPPYMHDGCASTLLDRFDATCGGSRHGTTGDLDEAELADLVAYLETL
jgi:hypothetical protein